MIRRWFVPSLLLLVLMSLFTAQACGPDFQPDVFVRKMRPDHPKEFAAGKLGVLLPTYPRADLTVAFRYLNGGSLTPTEQAAFEPTEAYYSEEEWAGRWKMEDEERKRTVDPAESWMNARAEYRPKELKVEQERELKVVGPDGNTFGADYLNCNADAFRTAVLTLHSRAKTWGEKSGDLADWLKGQDAVFANCRGGTPTMPTKVPTVGTALLKADRAYQVAAAEFYAAQFEEARKDFEAIGQDANSPWQGIARYLAGRCLVREAFFADKAGSGDGTAGFDPKIMRRAADAFESLLNEKIAGISGQAIQNELDLVRLRLEPLERIHELAVALAGPKADPAFSKHLIDLTWYLDQQLDRTAIRQDFEAWSANQPEKFSKTYVDISSLRSSAMLVDWLVTFQSPAKEASAHALAEWKKTHQLYWLVAAITKATEKDAEAADLVTGAEQVKPNSPAWETLTYHRLRLLIALGRAQEARRTLDQVMVPVREGGRDSSLNLYLGLKMRASTNLNEFLANAPRKVVQDSSESRYSLTECLEVMKNPKRQYDCKKELSPVQFSRDAAGFFNAEAPLTILIDAAESDVLPEQLRRSVAIMAWVRSVLLKDDAAAARLLPLLPQKLLQEAGGGTGFRAVVAIVRNPGLRPYLDAGIQRSYSYDFVESYRDNWWSQGWGGGGYGDSTTPLERTQVSFLTPDQRSQGEREANKVLKQGVAEIYLGGLVLEYANEHPSDPDVPESLYLVLRMMRYGPGPSWSDNAAAEGQSNKEGAIGKAASRLLRQRYASSRWTKKAAPFAQ